MVSSDPSANLPIDIHCGKLLDWLLSRRHCNKEWQASSLKIREKIAKAIQDMPEHPTVTEMLAGTYITYFHCLRIIDVLKETEASTKNVFGRYSSQRMKDWQEICQLYEKDNLYLAEMTQLLQQYVQYEIPAYRKQVARNQQHEQDCERKEVEYEKLSKEAERQYDQECRQLHLSLDSSTASVRVALLRSAENLPEKFETISKRMATTLTPLVKYYLEFCSTTVGQGPRLETLRFALEKGLNATVYEYKHGHQPTNVERVSLLKLIEEEEGQEAAQEIDFNVVADTEDAVDFGIEAVDSGISVGEQNIHTHTEETVARGDDALFIFENRLVMQKLLSDLRELQAFFKVRSIEVRREESGQDVVGSLLAAAVQDDRIDRLKHEKSNHAVLESDLGKIAEIIKDLTDPNLKNLARIRVSPEYMQAVADKVTEPRRRSEKFKQSISIMKEQQEEARQQARENQQRAATLAVRAKELQKFLENDISKRYNNRPVNIVGSTVVL